MWRETRRSISHFLWRLISFQWYTNGKTRVKEAISSSETELEKGPGKVEKNVPSKKSSGHARSKTPKEKEKTINSFLLQTTPLAFHRMDDSILVAPRKSRVNRVSKETLKVPLWKTKLKYNEYCG